MKCQKCGSDPIGSDYEGAFECGTLKDRSGSYHHTATCSSWSELRKPLLEKIEQLTSERDALQARVNRLEEAGDAMKWWCCEPESVSQWNAAKESKP